MSLHKAPETTLFFKTLSQKASANSPHLKVSREARILSRKHDMLSIKDVVNIYDTQNQSNTINDNQDSLKHAKNKPNVQQESLNKTLVNGFNAQENEGFSVSRSNQNGKQMQQGSLKNQILKKVNQHHGNYVSNHNHGNNRMNYQMKKDMSNLMQEDLSQFINKNTITSIQIECNKVKELLGLHRKEQLFQHKKSISNSVHGNNNSQQGSKIMNLRNSFEVRRNSSALEQDYSRQLAIYTAKSIQKRNKKLSINSTFQTISRDKREHILHPISDIPAPGQYKLNFQVIEANIGTVKLGPPSSSPSFSPNPRQENQNQYASTKGILNFSQQTNRKPIIEGQMNPHEMRFTMEPSYTQKINFNNYSKRDSSKHLETNFTGFLHYQPEIPLFYPNQPGYKQVNKTSGTTINTGIAGGDSLRHKMSQFQSVSPNSNLSPIKTKVKLYQEDNNFTFQHQQFNTVFHQKKLSLDKTNELINTKTQPLQGAFRRLKNKTQSFAFNNKHLQDDIAEQNNKLNNFGI
eukprot:403351201